MIFILGGDKWNDFYTKTVTSSDKNNITYDESIAFEGIKQTIIAINDDGITKTVGGALNSTFEKTDAGFKRTYLVEGGQYGNEIFYENPQIEVQE